MMSDAPVSVPVQKDDSPPDRTELINLLDQEIAYRSDRQVRSGWTSRAVIVAIAGVIWLVLGLLDNVNLVGVQVANYSVGLLFVLLGVRDVYKSINVIEPAVSEHLRFKSARIRTPTLTDSIYNVVVYVMVGSVILYGAHTAPIWLAALGILVLASNAALELFARWVVSWLGLIPERLPVDSEKSVWIGLIVPGILTVTEFAVGALFVLMSTGEMRLGLSLPELKVALLLVALVGLLKVWVGGLGVDRLLKELKRVRRRLTVGDLEVAEATKRLRQSILGLRGAQVLDSEMNELDGIFSRVEKCMEHVNAAANKIDEVQARVERSKRDLDAARREIESGERECSLWFHCVKAVEDLEAVRRRTVVKAALGIAFAAGEGTRVQEAYQDIRERISECKKLINEGNDRANSILSGLDAAERKVDIIEGRVRVTGKAE